MGLALIGSEYPLSAALLLVEWRENLLTVSAENVPMAQVLDSISRETGVVIEGLEAAGSPVSVRFAGLPLYEALEELQRGQPYVLVEAPLEGATSPRFIVSPAGAGPAPDAGDAPNESGEAQAIRKPDMQAPDPKARITALEAAMQVGGEGPETDAALVAALNDGDATVRRYAYERLRERGDARAADALIEAAAGGQVEVRAMLLRDLPNVDDARVFAVLRDATEDENPEIRGTAFETLAGGGQRAAEVLRERLLHPDPEMRMLALMALAAHGPELAREGAYALYNDEDERVKSQVEGLLAELDELRTRQSSARSSW